MTVLEDSFHRSFHYLRLSVTEACNFRCTYCLPNGYRHQPDTAPSLSVAEISRLATAFAELGFWKFRVTGGEPTVRNDILTILSALAVIPGVRRLALSTNGYRLRELAKDLAKRRVTAVNVSVDSLNRETFAKLTGRDLLPQILDGIDASFAAGIPTVKMNAVLRRDLAEAEIDAFLDHARRVPVSIRFIEIMRTGENGAFFQQQHVTSDRLQEKLVRNGWRREERQPGDGPAVAFRHADFRGTIGIIAPYSRDFCGSCNRLRVTCRGDLQLCLFGEGGTSLRRWLQQDQQKEELQREVRRLIGEKTSGHRLKEGHFGTRANFAQIGG